MTELAATVPPAAAPGRRDGVPVHELLRRLVVARLNERGWFLRQLTDALASEPATELIRGAVAAQINAAIRSHLSRGWFRALVAGLVAEILAERPDHQPH